MEPRYYDAALRIDHEAVKARALQLRSDAIDSAWKQLVSKVAALVDGLRLDPASPAGGRRGVHLRHTPHRPA